MAKEDHADTRHRAPSETRPGRRQPRSSDALRVAAIVLAVYVVLRFAWVIRSILLVVILGVLLGITMSKAVDLLERAHLRRAIGAVLIVITTLSLLVGLGALLAPTVAAQGRQITQQVPKVIDKAEEFFRSRVDLNLLAAGAAGGTQQQQQPPQSKPPSSGQPQTTPQHGKQQGSNQATGQQQPHPTLRTALAPHMQQLFTMVFPFVSNVASAAAGVVIVIFIAMYVAAEPRVYQRGLVQLIPPARRESAQDTLTDLAALLRQWFIARLLAMVTIGTLTGLALWAMGVPAAAALGLFAGVMEFIPFVGPIVSAIPAIAMALAKSPATAMWVALLFFGLQQMEGVILTPLLMRNRMDVPPAITIFAVSALGVVFGIIGMLVAEPLAAATIFLTRRLYVERMEANE